MVNTQQTSKVEDENEMEKRDQWLLDAKLERVSSSSGFGAERGWTWEHQPPFVVPA